MRMVITIRRCTNGMHRLSSVTAHVVLFGFILVLGCENSNLCVDDEIGRVPSPDKRVEAVITNGNCGATTSYSYRVSVVQAGKAPVESDTVFLADKTDSVIVSWEASKKLMISYKEARIFNFTNFWSSKEVDNFHYIVSVVEARHE